MTDVRTSKNIDTLAFDMYEYISETMAVEDINTWISAIVKISAAHMESCADSANNLSKIDSSFLMYENAFLYMLGLAQSKGILPNSEVLH